MRTLPAIGGVAAAFLLFVPAALAQTTWSVDQGGGGDFLTIQDCIDAAVAGDTCLVEPGAYVEHIDFLGKDLTVRGAVGPDGTVIDGQGIQGAVVTFANGESEDAILEGVTVHNGVGAMPPGHGIYCQGASPTLLSCVITANSASSVYGSIAGAGVYLADSSALLHGCTISDNSLFSYKGSSRGGGLYCSGGAPRILDCVIKNNEAADTGVSAPAPVAAGGGVYCDGSDAVIVNTVISGNRTSAIDSHGAGIACFDASPTITHSVVTENDAGSAFPAGEGGGIQAEGTSAPVVTNSVLWMNVASAAHPEIYLEGAATITVGHSIVTGGWPGVGNLNQDPLFVGGGDYHLSSLSPCIDAGDNAAPEIPATDVDGDPRILDGDGDSIAVADMGIDEYAPAPSWTTASIVASGRDSRTAMGSRTVNGLAGLLLPFLAVLLLRGVRRRTR